MRLFICAFLGALWLAAPAAAAQWTDAMGRTVEVPNPPGRIISLVPSVTEILFAIGVGEQVVGVTDACNWPKEAGNLPKVGSYSGPSLEAVLSQQPDVVFAAADMSTPVWVERLEDLGIAVYVVYPRSLDGTIRAIREIGQVSGAPEKADALASRLEDTAERIRGQNRSGEPPRTLVAVMVAPLVVAGPRTLAGDLLEIAGGKNIVPAKGGRWPKWGPEALLVTDPEVIIVSPHPGAENPEAFFHRYPELQAVRNNRIVSIDPDWLQRPGPRLLQGMEALAEALKTGERNVQ